MKFLTRFHHSWNLEIWFSSRKWRKWWNEIFDIKGPLEKEFQTRNSKYEKVYTHIHVYTKFLPSVKKIYFCEKNIHFLGVFLMWIQNFMLVDTLGSPYWLGCAWQIYILNQCIPVGNRQIQFLLLKLKIDPDQIIPQCVHPTLVELFFDYDVII